MPRALTIWSAVVWITGVGWLAAATAQTRGTASVRLADTLSTGSTQAGDTFTATLATPLVVNGHIAAPEGAYVTGRVRNVASSRLKRPPSITLSLDSVHSGAAVWPMQTGNLTIKADSQVTRNLVIIGGSAGAGSVIGAAAGAGKGAAIGAIAGAGAGTVGAYLTSKREIVLPAETLLTFHVNSVTISPKELARLQRVAPYPSASGNPPPVETVILRERHYHGDDDDDDDDQHDEEHEHRYSHEHGYPRNIDVMFLPNHHASVVIYWPSSVERITLQGDDLDDILEPLCERTRLSVEVIRTEIRVRHDD